MKRWSIEEKNGNSKKELKGNSNTVEITLDINSILIYIEHHFFTLKTIWI